VTTKQIRTNLNTARAHLAWCQANDLPNTAAKTAMRITRYEQQLKATQ
jgi:hypothetical protein